MEVDIVEAAVRLKVSQKTVHRWVTTGRIPGVQRPTNRGNKWFIELPDDLTDDTPESAGELEAYKKLVDVLEGRLEAADQELMSKNKQIEQLHILLQQAQSALPTPQGRPTRWWKFWVRHS
jgi:Helix-turn-helix domain